MTAVRSTGSSFVHALVGVVAVFMILLGADTLFWLVRGTMSGRPLVIGQDGISMTLLGEVFVPWSEVTGCRLADDDTNTVLVDLAAPISHYATRGWRRRKTGRVAQLRLYKRYFAVDPERLVDLILGHLGR